MSKALVLRNITHVRMDEDDLSLCGLSTADMFTEGESRKIKGVKHDDTACKQCLVLHLARWEELVADYNAIADAIGEYSAEDWAVLLKCLDLVSGSPALKGLVNDDAEPEVAPPVKKTTGRRPAKKTGGKA